MNVFRSAILVCSAGAMAVHMLLWMQQNDNDEEERWRMNSQMATQAWDRFHDAQQEGVGPDQLQMLRDHAEKIEKHY